MKKLEKLAAKAVNAIIDSEIYGWPPVCFGMFYQPNRPTLKPEKMGTFPGGEKMKDGRNLDN